MYYGVLWIYATFPRSVQWCMLFNRFNVWDSVVQSYWLMLYHKTLVLSSICSETAKCIYCIYTHYTQHILLLLWQPHICCAVHQSYPIPALVCRIDDYGSSYNLDAWIIFDLLIIDMIIHILLELIHVLWAMGSNGVSPEYN